MDVFYPRLYSRIRLVLALMLVAPFLASAAITVNGLSTKSTHSTGSVIFTVSDETGFTIIAELDGVPIPTDTAHTETRPGYHELFVTKTPDGGGADESTTLQFILRDPSRPSSDNGMPTWTPYPPVDAPAAALDGTTVEFNTPSSVTVGQPFPIILRLTESGGAISKLNATAAFPVDPSGLVPGDNLLAVEMHQAGPTSSDISFDLKLTATAETTNVIDATNATIDGRLHIFWATPGTVPQSSTDLSD